MYLAFQRIYRNILSLQYIQIYVKKNNIPADLNDMGYVICTKPWGQRVVK